MDKYLMFDSHHPLIHKLGVIRTLFHRADNIPSTEESKSHEREHLKLTLKICGYQNWCYDQLDLYTPQVQNEYEIHCY